MRSRNLPQISSKYYSETRHMSWSRAVVTMRRLGFNSEKRGLVKMYQVKLKGGKTVTVYEGELKKDNLKI